MSVLPVSLPHTWYKRPRSKTVFDRNHALYPSIVTGCMYNGPWAFNSSGHNLLQAVPGTSLSTMTGSSLKGALTDSPLFNGYVLDASLGSTGSATLTLSSGAFFTPASPVPLFILLRYATGYTPDGSLGGATTETPIAIRATAAATHGVSIRHDARATEQDLVALSAGTARSIGIGSAGKVSPSLADNSVSPGGLARQEILTVLIGIFSPTDYRNWSVIEKNTSGGSRLAPSSVTGTSTFGTSNAWNYLQGPLGGDQSLVDFWCIFGGDKARCRGITSGSFDAWARELLLNPYQLFREISE